MEDYEKDMYKRTRVPMSMLHKIAVMALVVAGVVAYCSGAKAEPKPILLAKGTICDTLPQLEQLLRNIRKAKKAGEELERVKGCGYIAAPVWATITPVKVFEPEPGYKVHIGKYIMGAEQIVQYGWYKVVDLKKKVRSFDI